MARDRVNKPHVMCHKKFVEMPAIPPELANNNGNPNYWPTLATELLKRIPKVPTKTPPKCDKLANRVAPHNPKVYGGNYDPLVLEE